MQTRRARREGAGSFRAARIAATVAVIVAGISTAACTSGSAEQLRMVAPEAGPGSCVPNLVAGDDGRLYLSWVEPRTPEGHRLRFSVWRDEAWTEPRTVAEGNGWFINWADFPSIAADSDGTLAAHWLVRSGESTYAYDIVLSVSVDGGDSWTDPIRPHRDGTTTEHGFVSLVPRIPSGFDVVWLDGRQTADDATVLAPGAPRAMTLRHAVVRIDGSISTDELLDDRVCDCCQTAAVRAARDTLLVAYRDRTEDEIRDIYTLRGTDGAWGEAERVHPDDWRVAGCPVNGPSLAAFDRHVALAWFTVDEPPEGTVKLALSSDEGRTFSDPVILDDDSPLGRVDVTFDDEGNAQVVWLAKSASSAEIRIRIVDPSGTAGPTRTLLETSPTRASGFPRSARHAGRTFLAWTVTGDASGIGAAFIR